MLLMASILLAASAPTSATTAPSPSASAVESCALPEGWSEVASRQPRYVVFGELHGTQQSPAFIGNLACALASQKQRILVGVELDSTTNEALQDAWKLPPDEFNQALVRAGWRGREDGVASQAMFAMLVRLHSLKATNLSIDVVAFNGTRNETQQTRFANLPGQGPHEAAQAENIHEAATQGSYDQVLILVGWFHAEKTRYGEGTTSFEPMAARLASFAPVVSLKMHFAQGTAWNCIAKPGLSFEPGQEIPSDAIKCSDYPAKGDVDLKRLPFIGLGTFSGEEPDARYDGFFWLGPVSGSAPQVPN